MNPAITITLGPAEVMLANFLGTERPRRNRAAGIKDRFIPIPGMDPAQNDIDAAGAELAFGRLFNVYVDMSTEPRSGGGDLMVAGRVIDVKRTKTGNRFMLATLWKSQHDSDLYACMIGTLPTYIFGGICTANDMLAVDNITDFGHDKPCHAVPLTGLVSHADLFSGDK